MTAERPRLSVNLSDDAVAFIRETMAQRGISATETVRRALAIYKYVEDQQALGNTFSIIEGNRLTELVIL